MLREYEYNNGSYPSGDLKIDPVFEQMVIDPIADSPGDPTNEGNEYEFTITQSPGEPDPTPDPQNNGQPQSPEAFQIAGMNGYVVAVFVSVLILILAWK